MQNLAPGAADRLGLDGDGLRDRHPALITCSVSGYGAEGPYRHKKAYDLLVQCETGLLSVTGSPDAPAKAGISVADIAAGMYAYSGILTALYERERTGRGTSVDVSLLEALGEWMTQPVYFTSYGRHPAQRTGARHTSISPYGPYAAAGGAQVFIGLQNEREWAVLCRVILDRPELIGDERFATNPDRVAHDRELTAIIEQALSAIAPGPAHRAAGRGGHRQRPAAHPAGVRRPPPARGAGPVAGGGHAGRPRPGHAPAGHRARPGGRHAPGPGPGRALRGHPGRVRAAPGSGPGRVAAAPGRGPARLTVFPSSAKLHTVCGETRRAPYRRARWERAYRQARWRERW